MSIDSDVPESRSRVLLVGEDASLLSTRAMILADWHPGNATSSEAMAKLHAGEFDVVIIGQLVGPGLATESITAAQKLNQAPDIVAIRYPEDESDLVAEWLS